MEYHVGHKDLKKLTQRRQNLIDGYILSYWCILNYHIWLDMIKQEKKLADLLCDIELDHLGLKDDNNNIVLEV